MALKRAPRAVVTGAASGLGRAFVELLVAEGATVLASDVNEAGLDELSRALGAGERLKTQRADVTDAAQVEALAVTADALFAGGVELVVNNAGVGSGGPVGDVPLSEWERVMRVNFFGVLYGCHAFVPRMKRAGHGHVLNVASMAGLIHVPEMGAYNASKAAVVAMSESLRGELEQSGVTVSVLCPAFFETNIMKEGPVFGRNADKQRALAAKLMRRSPLDAQGVARYALDRSRKGEFFLLPHGEGRVAWRVKRAVPERFNAVMRRVRSIVG
jgi:NAD(P)-dependent dehydrogenase (short-subunit alcohol dehydrogenase family)